MRNSFRRKSLEMLLVEQRPQQENNSKFYSLMKIKIVLFLMLCSTYSLSQSGYKISFKVKGWKDFPAYLTHFYGEQTYIRDTANVNSNGEFFFDNKNKLPH